MEFPTRTLPWKWVFRFERWRGTCTRYSQNSGCPRGVICLDSSRAPAEDPVDQEHRALIGRSEDVSSAGQALQGGTRVAVLLLGDHGIGKSTLMEAVAAELRGEV